MVWMGERLWFMGTGRFLAGRLKLVSNPEIPLGGEEDHRVLLAPGITELKQEIRMQRVVTSGQ